MTEKAGHEPRLTASSLIGSTGSPLRRTQLSQVRAVLTALRRRRLGIASRTARTVVRRSDRGTELRPAALPAQVASRTGGRADAQPPRQTGIFSARIVLASAARYAGGTAPLRSTIIR